MRRPRSRYTDLTRPRAIGRFAFATVAFAAFSSAVPLYTAEQAARGKRLYESRCSACHGPDLKGLTAPPLAGPVFATMWSTSGPFSANRKEDFTVDDLFFVMRTTMPPGASKSLTDQEHAAILAYVLQQNGYETGRVPLDPGSRELKSTKLRSSQPLSAGSVTPPPAFLKGTARNAAGGPTQEELNGAERSTRDWLYHTHNYSGTRFVPLDQIHSENARNLRVACAHQLGEIGTFQTGPIVYDGTMYVTTLRSTIALDATNCRPKWRHRWDPKARESWPNNRGVAIKDGTVVRATGDGYLLALNAQTGELIWARRAADTSLGETFTMAPLLYRDLVLIGPAGSENGISGWVGAFRLADGSPVWKFKTVPGADEKNSKSWPNPAGIKLGGGAVWTPFSLDTEKDELYVAVTNPAPDLPAGLRPGDNLYTNSLVALDVSSGKLRWHQQLVPNDSHDWDLTQVSPLFKTKVAGREASLVATAGKDGILRTIDRNSREILYRTPITTIKNADAPVTKEGVSACPGVLGGVEWNGPAYNPVTNLLYVGAVDWCSTFWSTDVVRYIPGRLYMGGSVQMDKTSQGWITAVDGGTGEVRWRYRSAAPIVGAVTTTAGDLVLSGELAGDFLVLSAKTGEVVHRFNTGGAILGGIVTYQIQGSNM